MAIVTGTHPATARLLDALGLKGREVRSVHLQCQVNSAWSLVVELYVSPDELDEAARELELWSFQAVDAPADVKVKLTTGVGTTKQ